MDYPSYEGITYSKDGCTFKFEAEGPHGTIPKVVQFKATQRRGVYSLSFGDLIRDGYLDYTAQGANGDHERILTTVALTVFVFLERYPRRAVIFQGSTPARTRLYRMAINRAFDELNAVFYIQGFVREENGRLRLRQFAPAKHFDGFLVRKRQVSEYPNPPP
jgi:hypothetical protein